MSTLFETYYDSLGHEIFNGSSVMAKTCGYLIYGHVVNFDIDKKGEEKFVIIPDIGYKANTEVILKKKYKVSWKNVYLINIKKK
jgi:hypothetical protein